MLSNTIVRSSREGCKCKWILQGLVESLWDELVRFIEVFDVGHAQPKTKPNSVPFRKLKAVDLEGLFDSSNQRKFNRTEESVGLLDYVV